MTKIAKFSKKDIDKILSNYDIGIHIKHKHIPWALANDVYRLNTTDGKFILKFHKGNDFKKFKYILNIKDFLRKRGIPIPELIKTKSSKEFILYNGKTVTVEKFIEGKEGKSKSIKEIKLIAKTMAITDKVLLKIPLKRKNVNYTVNSIIKVPEFNLSRYEKLLNENFKTMDENKLRRSVIHADLGGNYIVKDNEVVAIIDWDDACEDRLVMEPAVFIASNFVSDNNVKKGKIKLFMREYQRYMKLNKVERKALYYLVQARQLGAIAYLATHYKKQKNNKELRKYIFRCIKQYHIFSRVSPEEFSTWIN